MHRLIKWFEKLFSWNTVRDCVCTFGMHDWYIVPDKVHLSRKCDHCQKFQWYYSGVAGPQWITSTYED